MIYRNIGILLYSIVLLIIGLNADQIILLFTKDSIDEATILLRIMILVPIFVHLNSVYGYQILINIGNEKLYSLFIVLTGMISILLLFIFVKFFGFSGAAVARLVSEFLLALLMFVGANNSIKSSKFFEKY
jgi:PST family polysaccharide transporter